jgi:hypothetical protein
VRIFSEDNMTGISQREFAKRERCSPKLVRNRLQRGYLIANPDGTINPDLVGSGWRKANADRIATAKAVVARAPAIPSKAESEARKEHFLSALKELEYDALLKRYLPADEVKKVCGKAITAARAKLLALPHRVAARLVGVKTAAEIQRILYNEVCDVLHDMASDAQPVAG